jgi:hypothetical protein
MMGLKPSSLRGSEDERPLSYTITTRPRHVAINELLVRAAEQTWRPPRQIPGSSQGVPRPLLRTSNAIPTPVDEQGTFQDVDYTGTL